MDSELVAVGLFVVALCWALSVRTTSRGRASAVAAPAASRKIEAAGADAPGADAPRMAEPRVEVPRVEAPRMAEPRIDVPRMAEPRIQARKARSTAHDRKRPRTGGVLYQR